MFSNLCRSITILATIVIFYSTDLVMILRYDRNRSSEKSGRSWGFTLMALLFAACLVAQPLILPQLSLQIDQRWSNTLQIIGIVLLLGGLTLHCWSREHLRQFYAERVEIQPEHQLIDSGPYAYARHPMFTSYFMLVVGFLLVNPSLITLLIAIYAFWDFPRAAKQSETLLSEKLPGYTEYMERVPRFLPIPRQSKRNS